MAGKSRSPNYPSLSLGEAIEAMRPVYSREKRARFPRLSLANHLGYTSLNGRALAKMGAVRAYGLIDGREDSLGVSATGIALIEAPLDSPDRISALRTAFLAPPLFKRLWDEHGSETPSAQTLRWRLTQQGYVGDAADKALKVYLDSLALLTQESGAYDMAEELEREEQFAEHLQNDPHVQAAFNAVSRMPKVDPVRKPKPDQEGLTMGAHERVLQSGLLSKGASYRLIVSGHIGKAEFEKLLAKLRLDEDILTADDFTDPETDGVDIT